MTAVQQWLGQIGVKTLYIAPGSPWENGCNERFNGLLRNEVLNGEILYSLAEEKVLIEAWWWSYITVRRQQQPGLPIAGSRNAAPPYSGGGAEKRNRRPDMAAMGLID